MCRTSLLILSLLVVPALSVSEAVAISVTLEPVCGSGFEGTATDGTTTIVFRSCPKGSDTGEQECQTYVRHEDGTPMTEVRIFEGEAQVWLAGIKITSDKEFTQDELDRIEQILSSPEVSIAAELWDDLRVMFGVTESMRCLNRQYQAYEDVSIQLFGAPCSGSECNDSASGCRGCCGLGCTGGNGCHSECTQACAEHDDCARGEEPFSTDCNKKFFEAAVSSAQCAIQEFPCGFPFDDKACNCCD